MSKVPHDRERRVARSEQADLDYDLAEDREELDTSRTAAQFDELIEAASERDRDWIRRIVFALRSGEVEGSAIELKCFLERVRLHGKVPGGNLLSAAMSFLDGEDYEKRPWEDDSRFLLTASQYGCTSIFSLTAAALTDGNTYARKTAAKWLPKYAPEDSAVSLLLSAFDDPESEVRWWAAVHLSRLAPRTPGLVPVLISALNGSWCSSARISWDYGLTGAGEAAEALGHLGAQGSMAVPDLTNAILTLGEYDAQLAARAVWRISGNHDALRLLTPLIPKQPAVEKVVGEIKLVEQEIEIPKSPDDPPHACFIARFMWRPGEDDYWRYRTRDGRGAF
jgi:HEAT repeats